MDQHFQKKDWAGIFLKKKLSQLYLEKVEPTFFKEKVRLTFFWKDLHQHFFSTPFQEQGQANIFPALLWLQLRQPRLAALPPNATACSWEGTLAPGSIGWSIRATVIVHGGNVELIVMVHKARRLVGYSGVAQGGLPAYGRCGGAGLRWWVVDQSHARGWRCTLGRTYSRPTIGLQANSQGVPIWLLEGG